ncbi:hypothetical protein [Solicola sp. PLA-1-18]|uniref:hypothetical protein n=1 Tax=Solicola sp. PLA-1-18 TaxID=3380532 RepID=UPI003B7E9F58
MTTSPPEPTLVYWGTVGQDDGRSPGPPPRRDRKGLAVVLGTVGGVFAVAAVGSMLVAPSDGPSPRDVAEDYVTALQRLDCDAVADVSANAEAARVECRVLSRRTIYRDGQFDVARQIRESRFDVTGVDERPRDADVDLDIELSGRTTPAVLRLVRDDEARWRVADLRVPGSRRF